MNVEFVISLKNRNVVELISKLKEEGYQLTQDKNNLIVDVTTEDMFWKMFDLNINGI